jgi:1,4-dihydroxy-2-naphthoate octaprenyltransferase
VGLGTWFLAMRPWSFVMTAMSCALAGALAYLAGSFDASIFAVTLLGLVAAHGATNLLNDYFDVRRGVDREGAPTARYRPHPYLRGQLQVTSLLASTLVLYLLAWLAAAYLSSIRGPLVVALGVAGTFFSVFYTMTPIQMKYRAFGEPAVFLAWGPLMTAGVYYVLTGGLSFGVLFASVPLGLFVALVLMANNIRDIEYDASSGIATIPVLLGRRAALQLFSFLLSLIYAWPALGVALGFSPWSLLPLLTTWKAFRLLRDFRARVPDDADPRTAFLLLQYVSLYILGLLLGGLL